jgi:hypothetical protein
MTLPERARLLSLFLCLALLADSRAQDAELDVLKPNYPQAFFFRTSESVARNPKTVFETWDATFSRLMGLCGKAQDEEIPGTARRNIDFFTRFKKAHPEQLVLLHYNGNARDPRCEPGVFFAGHWLYHQATKILADLPAAKGEAEIRVEDASLFRIGIGRYKNSNDDVGLCLVDAQGRPDWNQSEQVQLLSVDAKKNILRVKRGCYGTQPRAFPAGKAVAAAHVAEGPWGKNSNLLWFYNYATCCPRDPQGQRCGDLLADELARKFLPGGELAVFDGVEFDVLMWEHHTVGGRGLDFDADGKADDGEPDSVNTYGLGVVEFCRRLREKAGENTLLLADGMSERHQRAFNVLNGIESEGFPSLGDWELRDWSGGMNRHLYWARNGRPKAFNYINHKYATGGEMPGVTERPDVPWSTHRLVLAAACFTDAAVCYSFPPPSEPGEAYGIWDELQMGTTHRPGWLGKASGPTVRLAAQQPDLLKGATPKEVKTEAGQALRWRIEGIPCQGPDLFVQVTARGEPMKGYPKDVARLMWVGIPASEGHLVRSALPTAGVMLRDGATKPIPQESGASIRWMRALKLNEETHPAYAVHPPYIGAKGATYWECKRTVPLKGKLAFLTGLSANGEQKGDGVLCHILVDGKQVFEHTQKKAEWTSHEVSLADWGGKNVTLRFVSDCGPKDNAVADHSYWAEVLLTGPGGRKDSTPPARYMSWAGSNDFVSGFYFHDLRSDTVDLEIEVEGDTPATLAQVTAHAYPDAIYRTFEHGVVLANAAPRPFTFDLEKLFPGRTLKRLQASSKQDTRTNDGASVRGPVTLGPKDALFLVGE